MHTKKLRSVNQARFTLIELLIVISIIGLLASLALPSLSRARDSARRTACASNLRQISMGFQMYQDDNNWLMPPAALMKSQDPDGRNSIGHYLELKSKSVYRCPSDPGGEFFSRETTSYEYSWNLIIRLDEELEQVSIKRIQDMVNTFGISESNINIMKDFEPFHKDGAGGRGGKNYLYADGRVGDYRGSGVR